MNLFMFFFVWKANIVILWAFEVGDIYSYFIAIEAIAFMLILSIHISVRLRRSWRVVLLFTYFTFMFGTFISLILATWTDYFIDFGTRSEVKLDSRSMI